MKSARLFAELTPEALAARVPLLAGARPAWCASIAPGTGNDIRERGWSSAYLDGATTTLLHDAVEALRVADLPLVALYAFDATWSLGEELALKVGAALGSRYELIADFWTFWIPPGQEGWPAHRGVQQVLDREHPELVNVWVALSDAAVDQSCMHFVPLTDDAAYRAGDLTALDPRGAVAAPVGAGTALFWNANILHWGGPCAASARGPRVSATFTLQRADAAPASAPVRVPLDPWQRIDAIAEQVLTYAPASDDALREWAAIQQRMRAVVP